VAQAQEYPTETIQVVIPTTPGAGMDITGRLFAKFLQEQIGRDVIVLNKPGAQTLIGAKFVALAPPKGHVLLFSTNITNFPVFIKNPGIDVSKDMEFISIVLRAPQIITVPTSAPDKTIADLVARSKTRPSDFFYASYGQAIWLITEQFNRAAGIQAKILRFNGGAEAALAIERGEADYFASSLATIRPALEGGKMRMLAVTSHARNPNIPDVPSLPEAGVNTEDLQIWMGVFAPKGTPRPIIDKLNKIAVDFTKDPTAAAFIRSQGFEPTSATPEQFREMFIREEQGFIKIGKDLGIQPE
jgi:tripartite-type tricarboxylate transporter receptor subunit TctC